ncbi:HD domain-containing protein [Evansella tamaricis]|uniref:HD domain-containing protein n=1 Tax=Evansella tamaricis TaxID=2069301 RepID=A0ABS6J947_9BACI|nr:HD domain-containing protein [Evansella tamaricis]MBU9710217.1 HD domain-containing protein [Evansella tamaricis]
MHQVKDPIYGEFEIAPVLRELIESAPVQRLKGIHQGGASYLVNPKWNVTRYDHSIGVMVLIQKLGGSVEEQIAGLLHDVSHTAFSHVIDFVFENKEENYHEKIYEQVVLNSQIPEILSKHNYDYKDILLDDAQWTLLEQPAPELCADRVDYTLRDMLTYGQITSGEVEKFLADLTVIDGKMYLQSIEIAEWFTETYYKEVIGFFLDPLNIYGYDTLAKTLKLALIRDYIHTDDFLSKDEELMHKLRTAADNGQDLDIQALLNQLDPNVCVSEATEEERECKDYDIHLKKKVRLIDPSVLQDNKTLVQASVLSEKIRQLGKTAKQKATKGTYIKVHK